MAKWMARLSLALVVFSAVAWSATVGVGAQRAAALVGEWKGGLRIAMLGTTVTLGFRFMRAADGSIVGYIVDPERGTRARVSGLQVANGKVVFEQPILRVKYEGMLSGMTLRGTWTQPQLGTEPFDLTRAPLNASVSALALSAQDMRKVGGTWKVVSGDAKGITMQLETTADGKRVGYVDLPAFNLAGVPLSEASLNGGQLLVKMGSINCEYRAQVSAGQLQGEWKYSEGAFPLAMVRQ